uniref:Uncharacterized protein n=1 Tax=Leersia perrieri TaxID=77586 RepID=A0A0D9WDS9_9ORYZ
MSFVTWGFPSPSLQGLAVLHTIPSEAIAINVVIQLHRLLVNQGTTMAVSSSVPIVDVLDLITSLNPKEADHNKLSLLERFNNSLFYYAAMFDSLEAASRTSEAMSPATRSSRHYCRGRSANTVSHEGSSCVQRHKLMTRWMERIQRAGLTQVPHD